MTVRWGRRCASSSARNRLVLIINKAMTSNAECYSMEMNSAACLVVFAAGLNLRVNSPVLRYRDGW